MDRDTGTCGTIIKDLRFTSSEFRKEKRKKGAPGDFM